MIDLDEFRDIYFEECEDLFAVLEKQLDRLRDETTRTEAINEVFRAVHSIKGGAGALRLERIVAFAHRFETFFDLARAGKLTLDDVIINLAFVAADMLVDLVGEERRPGNLPDGAENQVGEKLDRVIAIITEDGETGAPPPVAALAASATSGGPSCYRIRFSPGTDIMRSGTEPLFLFRELGQLGDLSIDADPSGIPDLETIDPLSLYIGWTMRLDTTASLEEIEEVFEFVATDDAVDIGRIEETGATDEAETNTQSGLKEAVSKEDNGNSGALTGDAAVKNSVRNDIGSATIRVDLERVDKLVNLVGQIAISQTLVAQHLDEQLAQSHPGLVEEIEQLQQYTQALQDGVMAIRALPVGLIFSRLPKLVREVSRLTGKPVKLHTSGEETEIDKTVIEQLYDPLMHMVRNAIGHGIEEAHVREAAGKPAEGRIELSAWQSGGKIVIRLSDDGAGIDRSRVRAKAIANGLIAHDADLSDGDIDRLILTPGFSTAEEVSEVSGRGVGMDVVCENIHRLGGQVAIQSEPGRGTSVTMALPLTLAVMDGMTVRVAAERYVIPTTTIIQTMPLQENLIKEIPGEGDVLRFRDNYVKLVRLENVFGIPVRELPDERLVVLLELEGLVIAVVVDEIIGQLQVVTKTLEQNFKPVPGISAATIMGDGEVALILDPSSIANMRPTKGTIAPAPVMDDIQRATAPEAQTGKPEEVELK